MDKIKELYEKLCPEVVAFKLEDDLKAESVKDEDTDDSISLIEDIEEDKEIKDEHQLDCKVKVEEWHTIIKDEKELEKESLKEEVTEDDLKEEEADTEEADTEAFVFSDSPLQYVESDVLDTVVPEHKTSNTGMLL